MKDDLYYHHHFTLSIFFPFNHMFFYGHSHFLQRYHIHNHHLHLLILVGYYPFYHTFATLINSGLTSHYRIQNLLLDCLEFMPYFVRTIPRNLNYITLLWDLVAIDNYQWFVVILYLKFHHRHQLSALPQFLNFILFSHCLILSQ